MNRPQRADAAQTAITLFDGIEPQDLDSLLGCLKAFRRSYRAGQFILLDQDTVRHVGVLLSGSLHMIKEDGDGHRILLSWLEPGDLFGENFFLQDEPRSYVSFLAAADCQVLFLSLEHLLSPCRKACPFHLRIARNCFRLIGEKNRQLMEKIEVCAKGSLRDKILTFLRQLAARQGQKYIRVPLTRTEMASYLQANRSAMTRELAAMKADGLIDFDGSIFVLKV